MNTLVRRVRRAGTAVVGLTAALAVVVGVGGPAFADTRVMPFDTNHWIQWGGFPYIIPSSDEAILGIGGSNDMIRSANFTVPTAMVPVPGPGSNCDSYSPGVIITSLPPPGQPLGPGPYDQQNVWR